MKHCKWILYGSLLVLAMLVQPASAVTDYVFFSVYGDTTVTEAVQGDSIGFGANCEIGATIFWQIWVDADSNQTTGDPGDKVVLAFTVTDGGVAVDGPSDVNPVPDGWFILPSMLLGFAPAHYIMVATDMTDATSAEKAFSITPMLSPPNMFTGTVTLEGISAPDPQLAHIWIWAEPDSGGMQIWTALTDNDGYYEVNMSAEASGQYFEIRPENLPGFVTPPEQYQTVSGQITGIDFDYTLPVDSIYGNVLDEDDNPLYPAYVYCSPQGGGSEKEYEVTDGSYVIYFGASELGQWWLGVSSEMMSPNHMVPWGYLFDNTSLHGINQDLVCYTADTVVYAKITEEGGAPTYEYRLTASDETLGQQTYGVSGTGADNVVTLHVSSLESSYQVSIAEYDDQYPIPDGFIIQGGSLQSVGLGDTATFNLVTGYLVQDTITVLAPHPSPGWSGVWVNCSKPGVNYGTHPDNDGVYRLYVDTGTYQINVNYAGYLVLPQGRTVEVTGDTIGGMGFTLNRAHCRVEGYVTGLPLPIDSGYNISATSGAFPNAYYVNDMVDPDGWFRLDVCDGDWEFNPPPIPGARTPDPVLRTYNHSTTSDGFNFVYEPLKLVSGTVTVDPDDLPVTWSNVQVRLNGSGSYQIAPDNDGNYAIYADTGMYMLDAYYINYLTTPGVYLNIHLLEDTTAGLDFYLNKRDIRVYGHILGISLPIPGGPYNIAGGTDVAPAGYHVASSQVDLGTGYWEASVCDGYWTFTPPDIPGYVTPLPGIRDLTELDTVSALDFSYTPLSVDDPLTPQVPADFELAQNSPNPFNMGTRIEFALPKSAAIELAVYNILGQKVKTLAEGTYSAGAHAVLWNGMDESGMTVSTGIYFYRLNAGEKVLVRKMVVLK